MSGLITMGLLPGQSMEITGIHAAKRWNRTGLLLECGVRYTFEVLSYDGWRDGSYETDPNGYSKMSLLPLVPLRRHPFAKWMKLIGAEGTRAWHYFAIGMGRTYRARSSGELYCFANDASHRYHDNDGQLVLKVTRPE